jgi:hypothetical protein
MMTRIIKKTAIAFAAIATIGSFHATTAEAKVIVMQAGSPALAPGSSYEWADTNSATVDSASIALANQITAKRLKTAIDATMASRGYLRSPSPMTANLAVSFHVVVKQQKGTRVMDTGATVCGWRGCFRTWYSNPVVTQYDYTQGTLVIDLVDTKTGALVWRAASEERVTARDVSQARLNSVVAKMMKSLPTA